jgi:ABC-type thiamine transport system substrate-binding protein
MDSGGSTDMTLAFELEALKALADPNAVFNNARQWTEYVGVVSEKPTYVVTNFTRKHRVRQDFFSGPRGVEESLENISQQFDTDRHVFVGVDADDEAVADATDWEFLHVEDAADAAGWTLATGEPEDEESDEQARDDWP